MGIGGQGDVWTKSALTLVATICILIFYRSPSGVTSSTTWHHPVKFHCFVFCVASTAVYFPDACLYFWMSSVLFGDTAKWEPSENSDYPSCMQHLPICLPLCLAQSVSVSLPGLMFCFMHAGVFEVTVSGEMPVWGFSSSHSWQCAALELMHAFVGAL